MKGPMFKVVACTIMPDGSMSRKALPAPMSEKRAWKKVDELNEKNSLETDMSKPLVTYVVEKVSDNPYQTSERFH